MTSLVRISQAEDAYYEVQYEVALRKLDEASSTIADAPATVRSRYYLWRTAVLLAQGKTDDAAAEARNAVDANPNVRVDLTTYPKDVQELIAKAKEEQKLIDFDLQVTSDVQVWLDGVSVGSSFKVSPGSHRLSLYAPHCKPVSQTEELRGGGKIRPPLVPALSDDRREALTEYLSVDEEMHESFQKEVESWDVDIVVLGVPSDEGVELVVYKPSVTGWTTDVVQGARAAGEWVVEQSVLAHREQGRFRPPPSIALAAGEPTMDYDMMAGFSLRSMSIRLTKNDLDTLSSRLI